MAKKNNGFSVRFPHFGLFFAIAIALAIPLTVWSLNNVSTNIEQHAAIPNPTSIPARLPSNLVQNTYCENSSDKLAGESAAKFSWTGVSGINQYYIIINEYPSISGFPNGYNAKIGGNSGVNDYQVPTNQLCINLNGKCGLYPGSKVMWTVAPVWADGTIDQSNWNNVWKTFTAPSCPPPAKLTVNVYLDINGNGKIEKSDALFVDNVKGYKTSTYISYDGKSPISNYVRYQTDIPTVSANSHTYNLLSNTQYYVTTQPPVGFVNTTPFFGVPVYLTGDKTVNILFKRIK